MNALLVIDMQNAWLQTPRHDKSGVIERINQAAHTMREKGGAVIFIRHVSDEAPLNSALVDIDADLIIQPEDRVIDKTACDSFADTELLSYLQSQDIKQLFICGLATEFCVDTTLRVALSQGFDVVALSDAHTTGNRPHLPAAQIVEHHNWVWQNLIAPVGSRVRVLSSAQAIALM